MILGSMRHNREFKHDENTKEKAIVALRRKRMQEDDEYMIAKERAQKKAALEISQAKDPQEKEADVVAKKVVEGNSKSEIRNSELNAELNAAKTGTVHPKTESDTSPMADANFEQQLDSSKGSGQSMDDATKNEMETKMGADFSDVKIHTGSNANEMSEDINAKAFAHGQDIYFKSLAYDPYSKEGKELLAHELWHTVQGRNGMGGKLRRQVEDINSINNQAKEMKLDDYSGLLIQVLGGFIPVYDALKATESCDKIESGIILKTGKKIDNRYEVFETVSITGTAGKAGTTGAGALGNPAAQKTNSTAQEKRYVEFGGTEWADMAVIELLPERLLYSAQANPGNDLSFYKIKVKWKFINLFEDEATKQFSKTNAAKNQELQLLGKNSSGNYPVDVTDAGGKIVRKYIRGSVPINSFDLISISKECYVYEANKNRGDVTDLSGYQIKIQMSEAYLYPYPTDLVSYDAMPITMGTLVTIADQAGAEGSIYYRVAIDKQSGYIPANIAVSDFEIVSAPTSMDKVKDIDVLSNEADKQAERNIKLATVDYSKVQNLLQTASENTGKVINGFNETFGQMTVAELSVLRGAHRMMILKALIVNKGMKDKIITLLKSTGTEVSGEMGTYLLEDPNLQKQLMTEYAPTLEDKKNMAAAIGVAAGSTSYVLDQIKTVLASDDYSEIDELAYTLADEDMKLLSADIRADIIDKMMIEANYYWHISSDSDDETMVRLVRTAKREDPEDAELLKFKKRIHPNFKGESGNLYSRLVETMATYCTREYQLALTELYPEDVNNVLLSDLRDKLKPSEEEKNAEDEYELKDAREDRREDASDDVLEWTLQLSHKALMQLTVAEKLEIIDIALWELEVGGEEETALIQLLAATSAEQYVELREGLEATVGGYEFHRLHELVSRIDESGSQDLRRVLNPIMEVDRSKGEASKLIDRINKLLAEKNDFAERYMFLLTDNLLEQLFLSERKLMIDESADYWADGTDESVIIRLVNTTQGTDRALLYEWFSGKDDNGYSNHQNWVMHSVDGANRDLFMQAVGALKGNEVALTDAKAGFDYGVNHQSDSKVLESVGLLTNEQMAALDFDTRIEYIHYICNKTGIVWVHGENIVTRLIETTPAKKTQYNVFVDQEEISQVTRLFKMLSANGGQFYTQIHDALDDETFNAMQQALQGLVIKQRYADNEGNPNAEFNISKEDELMRQQGFMHPRAILWEGFQQDRSSVRFNKEGKIEVTFSLTTSKEEAEKFKNSHQDPKYTYTETERKTDGDGKGHGITKYKVYVFTAAFAPTDMVAVISYPGYGGVSSTTSAAQYNMKVNVMPAIGLFENQVEEERAAREAMLLMLDIILLAVGIGELTMALRGIRLAFAIADVVIGALTIGIKAFRKQLMQTEEGRVFLGIVDGITVAYGIVGIGRLTAALYSMGKVARLRNQLNVLKGVAKDAELLRVLELLVAKLENPGPLYKTLFKISNEGQYKEAIAMIDTWPGLMKAEREALKKMADLKMAHPQMGPRAFLDYLSETPEELVKASVVKNEADMVEFRKSLDELEKEGKLTPKAREDAELAAIRSVKNKVTQKTKGASLNKYKTKEMDAQYKGEETGSYWGTKVKYLNESERADLELFIGDDGLAYDMYGKLMDTSSGNSIFANNKGTSIFVMDSNGRIFVSNYHEVGLFHHSSILAGKPVAAAGEIQIKNGIISYVSRSSGHYKPEAVFLNQFKSELNYRGVDTNSIKFDSY
jgi:Domain of unknown function (DUF4157)